MSGEDFYDKTGKTELVGPIAEEAVKVADPFTRRLLNDILQELKAIHWHLATITENDPDEIRRDMK